jgi:5-(carboxyamino)imidazole ribonucleotide synthase
MKRSTVVLPGSTIGMVGGGQLGRMFAIAAAAMGYRVVVFCGSQDEPAAQVASGVVTGDLTDPAAIECFAAQCDVITLEFENIPAATIAKCNQFAPTYPAASVLATAQDRLIEKSTLRAAGLPVTPFAAVSSAETCATVAAELGYPLIVKTARSGYDGKGQHRVNSAADIGQIAWDQCESWIAERCIPFDRELSAVVARTVGGVSTCFPVFENIHRHHILDLSVVPAAISSNLASRVRQIASAAAKTLDVVGLLCVEFFVAGDEVMINEVAPRPHNSGHLTIEACETSQFSQHVRAVCNLPLGSTQLRSPAAAMVNLLGDLWNADGTPPAWDKALSEPAIALHLYGKAAAKPGRKMGHLTITGTDRESIVQRIYAAREQLAGE